MMKKGRPKLTPDTPRVRIGTTLRQATIDAVRAVGDGEFSTGVERLVEKRKEKAK
jgi:hypothetical protein